MTTKRTSFLERYFYLFMSLLIAVVVVYGFSHTIDGHLLHPRPNPPRILYLHSLVFSGWVVFFILQSALVRSHNVRLHRALGWIGAGLAVSMLVLGYTTSIIMGRFNLQYFPHIPVSMVGLPLVQITDLTCFAVTFALAIYWRRRPDLHRRLMLIATCVLTEAAFGRFPMLHVALAYVGVDALILLGVFRDLIVERRIHKVYRYALAAMIPFQILAVQTYVHKAVWWAKIGNYLLR